MDNNNAMAPSIYLEPDIDTLMIITPQDGPQCFCFPVDFLDLTGKRGSFLKTMIYVSIENAIDENEGIYDILDSLTLI